MCYSKITPTTGSITLSALNPNNTRLVIGAALVEKPGNCKRGPDNSPFAVYYEIQLTTLGFRLDFNLIHTFNFSTFLPTNRNRFNGVADDMQNGGSRPPFS